MEGAEHRVPEVAVLGIRVREVRAEGTPRAADGARVGEASSFAPGARDAPSRGAVVAGTERGVLVAPIRAIGRSIAEQVGVNALGAVFTLQRARWTLVLSAELGLLVGRSSVVCAVVRAVGEAIAV